MNAESPAQDEHYLHVFKRKFRDWRGTRPFWAGLLVLLAGFPIMYFPYFNLQIGHLTMAMSTTAGAGSLIIGVLLVVLGINLWFQKHVRTFAGTAAILLGLVSLPVSNFGGFIIGFLLALVGGALAIAWAPGEPESKYGEPARKDTDAALAAAAPVSAEATDGADPVAAQSRLDMSKPNEPYEPNDLSGTSPVNGANGRHSAG
ncbi:DUF6114 domain-containing protein [Streptomyces sp. NBC_00576]|uniref:DUF6114 domain-containing protein n=1 Tax=Streptomyces sp. NBC_00576 TaxID=2903665 RepID=UPI002E8161B8|nr:DUF6114 domain-containing protein [Streptomyces sp. NBC_00576]WUB70997.1 DUF6114 domain-containing protein [Streptomyces sp. NBC_00576]